MKIAAEVAREQERAAEWARLRGEPMPEGYVPPQEKETRGTWMTELPPEKQVRGGVVSGVRMGPGAGGLPR